MNTVKSTLVSEGDAVRQANILAQKFRPQLRTKFTGRLRVALDGRAWMGEFEQKRGKSIVTTWYRLMVNFS